MSIVKYKNQTGQVYAYEQTSYWDPEKKQSRSKRTLLGRVDPDTGEIIPTRKKRGRPKKSETAPSNSAGSNDDYKQMYESVLGQLEDAKNAIEKLKSENDILMKENKSLNELVRMIHEKTDL